MELKELQEAFYEGIFHPDNQQNIEKICQEIIPVPSMNANELLGIYRGSILGGITDALSRIYPVCNKLVGTDYFDHMVAGYLQQHPSGSPDLGHYGQFLSDYISRFSPAKDLVYLADTALLEWSWHVAFNARDNADSAMQSIDDLAQLTIEQQSNIIFCLKPAVQLMKSDYPVQKIWQVNQDGFQGDPIVNLNDGAVNLVVWRDAEFEMRIDELTDEEFQFLLAIKEASTFGEIALMSFSPALEVLLPRCIQMGLVTGFTLSNN